MYVSTSGLYGTLSSTERRKKEIEPYQINEDALLGLDVKTFRFKDELDDDQEFWQEVYCELVKLKNKHLYSKF